MNIYVAPLPAIKVTVGGEYGGRRGHKGLDLRAKSGTPVAAVVGGEYVRSGFSSTHGYFGIWLGDDGNYWNVQHLKVPFAARGRIEAAEVIALSGATGNVSGPHLHIGVSTRNSLTLGTFDPAPLLATPPPPTETSNPMHALIQRPSDGLVVLIRPPYANRTVAQNEYSAFEKTYGPLRKFGLLGETPGIGDAEFNFAVYEANEAHTAFLALVPGGSGGGYNPGDADVVDEGEFGQALTSTASLVINELGPRIDAVGAKVDGLGISHS